MGTTGYLTGTTEEFTPIEDLAIATTGDKARATEKQTNRRISSKQ